ncbi:O-methyltransferase [Alteribacillus bidgolensis]|uniref:tRNA 5-hydroxyuridine methyltransferase n=1 Tax=Alteribacillus bidgolensis TaxID=930129 RepID=A0A1G8NA67_9BACI|nr:O-methyltransferase [Alteribacillus bidgolensis]SDI77072.1 caffeoyl-CoA O-methyltransferase [Alteribacillus bidgolensis]
MYEQPEMIKYIRDLNNKPSLLFLEMEKFAENNNVPIIETEALDVMLQILHIHNSKRILEIGTAIGYSALRIANDSPERKVISLEKDKERYETALNFRSKSKLKSQTTFVHVDALDETFSLEDRSPFDVLFIDASKGKYEEFFIKYTPCLKHKGLVITDNVFFKGLAAKPEDAPRRIRSMVRKIHSYNKWLADHPSFSTKFLAVGDGLAVSQKI